jgi:hypothetical protein
MTFVDNSLSSWFSLVFAIVVCHMARHAGVEVIEMKPSDYQIQNDFKQKKSRVCRSKAATTFRPDQAGEPNRIHRHNTNTSTPVYP